MKFVVSSPKTSVLSCTSFPISIPPPPLLSFFLFFIFFKTLLYSLYTTCIFFNKQAEWLVEIAPHYFDLENFPECEAKHDLEAVYRRRDESQHQRSK